MAAFAAWVLTASFIYGLVLMTHALRTRFTLAPLYILLGFYASLMMWLSTLGARVEFFGLTVLWGSTVYAGLLIAVFLLYVFDGTAGARFAAFTIVAVILGTFILEMALHLQVGLGISEADVALPPPVARVYAASAFAVLCDVVLMAMLWELLLRMRRLPLVPRVFITLFATLTLDSLVFLSLAFPDAPLYRTMLIGNIVDRLVLVAWVAPLLAAYVTWQRRVHGTDLGRRKVLSILRRSRESERRLSLAEQEIARREAVEKALRENEEQFRTLVENIPGITFRCLLDKDWTMLYMSEAALEVTGYPPQEFVQNKVRSYASIIHPDDGHLVENTVLSATDAGGSYSCGYRIVRADGAVRYLGERGQISFDENGKPKWLDGVISDVTERRNAEQALRASEERYDLALEAASDGLFDLDLSAATAFYSPQFFRMLGFPPDAFPHDLEIWNKLGHPDDDAGPLSPAHEEHRNSDAPFNAEFRMRDAEDSWKWILLRARVAARNESGQPVRMVGTHTDITARKLAERRSQRFEFIANAVQDLMTFINRDYVYEAVNDAWCRAFDRDRENVIGESINTIWGEDIVAQKIKPRMNKAFAGEDIIYSEWIPEESPDARFCETHMYPYAAADETGISHVVVVTRDTTEQKRAEMARVASEQRLALAIQAGHLAVWDVDVPSGKMLVNAEYMEALGRGAVREATLDQWRESIHPEDRDAMWQKWLDYTQGKIDTYELEYRAQAEDGEVRWMHTLGRATKRDNAGRALRVVGTRQDVTDGVRLQEELRVARDAAESANRAKSDFLATMSHEIRTPMNAIIGLSHLALQTELTRKQEDYLLKIDRSANALLGIINDILDFSKIEAGKLLIEDVPFDFSEVIENFANLMAVRTKDRDDLEVLIDIDKNIPSTLVGDPLRLGQVLTNLGGNAAKFTEQGEIVLKVRVLEHSADTVVLAFDLSDTGIGMTPEQVAQLFQPFSQADTSTTRKYGGTGLGLSICRKLVDLMGGDITVSSTHGSGSTFSFTVTCGIAREEGKSLRTEAHQLQNLHALVVDDRESARLILGEMLRGFGFTATTVDNGPAAVDTVRKVLSDNAPPFDFVLMDWKMPGMSGIETAQSIRALDPRTSDLPVILVTAYGREEVIQSAEDAGIDHILLKPIGPSVLFDMIAVSMGSGDAGAGKRTAARDSLGDDRLTGASVLLVEDNAINQQVATEILEGAGLTVAVAGNGAEALDALHATRYDAVLMDVQMPVMDGFTATRTLRKEEAFRDLPIIAMTANALAGDRERCLEAGMSDYVTKPIDPERLFEVLTKWIAPTERTAAASVLPEDSAHHASAPALPDCLPGIDLQDALKRVGQNKALLARLLVQFRDQEADAVQRLAHALDDNDLESAIRIAHTLKGLGGNLGARDIAAAATEVESHLKGKRTDAASETLPELAFALETVITGLEALSKTKPTTLVDTSTLEPREAAEVLETIASLVEVDLSEAMTRAEELANRMPRSARSRFAKARELLQNFDTDAARADLEILASELREGN
jgi:PAS domain S-box-containing protein